MLNETNRACKDLELQKQQDESPRFTLSELREVLQEKNALKTKVMELEEKVDRLQTSSPGIPDNFEFVNESTPATTEENLRFEGGIIGSLVLFCCHIGVGIWLGLGVLRVPSLPYYAPVISA
jgi:hypothetical protein